MDIYIRAFFAENFLRNCKKTLAILFFYDIICVNKMNDDVYNGRRPAINVFIFIRLLTDAK